MDELSDAECDAARERGRIELAAKPRARADRFGSKAYMARRFGAEWAQAAE